MKFIIRREQDRLHKTDSWKKSAYSFVPYQTHFGELCGFADDLVEPGKGFGMHPHQNMEISTIVISGSQVHKDTTGNERILNKNSVQTMSAGTGILHSEFNQSLTEKFHSYQIWVYPKIKDIKPKYEQITFTQKQLQNKLLLTISPDKRENSISINQDVFFSLTELEPNYSIVYKILIPNNGVYIHTVKGKVLIENNELKEGDAIGLYETTEINIQSISTSFLIFVETPMERGIKIS